MKIGGVRSIFLIFNAKSSRRKNLLRFDRQFIKKHDTIYVLKHIFVYVEMNRYLLNQFEITDSTANFMKTLKLLNALTSFS